MKSFNHYMFGVITLLATSACSSDKPVIESPQTEEEISENPLFKRLDAEESGFYFLNELRENPVLNILNYEYLYNGSGVAIGDINKDGLPDVFMGGNLFGGRLFLNLGDLKFKQISEEAGVFQPGYTTGVTMVDINGDGYDDLYLCRSLTDDPEQRRNVLLINNGDLTFTDKASEYGLDDPSFSTQANFFDYDNDGDLDMFLLNHRVDFKDALTLKVQKDNEGKEVAFKDDNTLHVSDKLFENNGAGKFIDVTEKAGLTNRCFGLGVSVADINKDGWQDLYIANDYADKDQLMINNGNGTFTDKIDDYFMHMSKNSMGCDIADFNNDAELDVINLDMMSEDNYRQKQLKGGSPYDLYHMAVNYGLGHQVMRNTLQLNNGNETFSEIGQLAGVSHTDWSWTPIFADFDNDGNKDLFISNGYYRDVTDMDYIKYESADLVQKAGGLSKVNQMDLVNQMKSNAQTNYIYKNNGDLTFTNKTTNWGLTEEAFSNGCAVADLDGDGDLDLITNNLNQESFIYENLSNKETENNFIEFLPSELGCKVWVFSGLGVQYIDYSPFTGYLSNHEKMVHFGLGEINKVDSVIVQWGTNEYRRIDEPEINSKIEISRLVGERCSRPLITRVTVPFKLEEIAEEYNYNIDYNDFKHEPLLERKNSNRGPFASKGDVNNDGLIDFYVGGEADHSGRLFLQQSTGAFKLKENEVFESDRAFSDARSVFFDVDSDGDLDLYVVSGGYRFSFQSVMYQDRLYLNDGSGKFKRGELPKVIENGSSVVSMDIDDDNDEDLVVFGGAKPGSYPYGEQSFALINQGGRLQRKDNVLPKNGDLGMVTDAKLISRMGKKHIILSREWGSIMSLKANDSQLENVSDQLGFSNTEGLWNCITIADINGDGNDDIIAGNSGRNNFFKASANSPATILAADFDGNQSVEAIPFYYYPDGELHPIHSLEELFAQNPSFRRIFPRYKNYSQATKSSFLKELKESNQRFIERQLKLQYTSVFVFENGKFVQQNLPMFAQFSEVHGIGFTDLNDDGLPDMILAGNNSGVNVTQGRMDAGGLQYVQGFLMKSADSNRLPSPYQQIDQGEYRGVLMLDKSMVLLGRNGSVWTINKAK